LPDGKEKESVKEKKLWPVEQAISPPDQVQSVARGMTQGGERHWTGTGIRLKGGRRKAASKKRIYKRVGAEFAGDASRRGNRSRMLEEASGPISSQGNVSKEIPRLPFRKEWNWRRNDCLLTA